MPIEMPEGAQLLVLDPEKVKKIWEHFSSISGILDDFGRDRFDLFWARFSSPDSVWIERTDGNGLLYATSIIPHLSASVHFVYWDKKLAGREGFTIDCLRWLMEVADLKKVNAWIPDFCKVAHKFAERLGFKKEAHIRRWSVSQGHLYDVLCFGMTKEEVFDGRVYDTKGNGAASEGSVRESVWPVAEGVHEPEAGGSSPSAEAGHPVHGLGDETSTTVLDV